MDGPNSGHVLHCVLNYNSMHCVLNQNFGHNTHSDYIRRYMRYLMVVTFYKKPSHLLTAFDHQ